MRAVSIIIFLFMTCLTSTLFGQTLTGIWELMGVPECYSDAGIYNAYTGKTKGPFAVTFDANMTGKTGFLNVDKNKITKSHKFLYKMENNVLFILNPRLHLITSSYTITGYTDTRLTLINRRDTCEELTFNRKP